MLAVRWPDTRMAAPCARFPDPSPFVTPVAAADGRAVLRPGAPDDWIAIYTENDLARTVVVQSHVAGERVSLPHRYHDHRSVIYPHGVAFAEATEYTVQPGAMARRLQTIPLRYATSLERFKDAHPVLRCEILLYIERARASYNACMAAYPTLGWWDIRGTRALGLTA
jgi:hypothetical protein